MSQKHPIIAVIGSTGSGTNTVKVAFEHIFYRENIRAALVDGSGFHTVDRAGFKAATEAARQNKAPIPSHFGPELNHFDKLEACFRSYGEKGTGQKRHYLHFAEDATRYNTTHGTDLHSGQFTPWEEIPVGTDLLFYEGMHAGLVTDEVNIARHVDLLVGAVPNVNLEWIQKIHWDGKMRGSSPEAVTESIMSRMRDYVNYITPQFSRTHINFQRVATVDTSNPFITRDVPELDESFIVIHFSFPKMADFDYLLAMIKGSFMSRQNTIVVPGGKMGFAMELILAPLIRRLIRDRD